MKKNPYTVLMNRAKQFAFDIQYRHKKTMWLYPKARLSEGWPLTDLAERVQAAHQLDYDVQLEVSDGNLVVQYIKRISIPYEFK